MDEQYMDDIEKGEVKRRFLLHYNFPPYSVGEAGRFGGTSRREIGHGNLARRAIEAVLPDDTDFPYTIRIVSDITESNGSSSMASVCGGILSLMDAGVPIKQPVAGVAMGLVMEGNRYAILSDIAGAEDHYGDMDFKVTGTTEGITALQMDIKIAGINAMILEEALEQARKGRLHILDIMDKAIAEPREDISPYAPRIITIMINPGQDPRRHRPGRQDDPLDHRRNRREDRYLGRRHGSDRHRRRRSRSGCRRPHQGA